MSVTLMVCPYALLRASARALAVSAVITSPASALITVALASPASSASRLGFQPRLTRYCFNVISLHFLIADTSSLLKVLLNVNENEAIFCFFYLLGKFLMFFALFLNYQI